MGEREYRILYSVVDGVSRMEMTMLLPVIVVVSVGMIPTHSCASCVPHADVLAVLEVVEVSSALSSCSTAIQWKHCPVVKVKLGRNSCGDMCKSTQSFCGDTFAKSLE
eukprot:12385495-Ditylum_brightwellii.AAC.1